MIGAIVVMSTIISMAATPIVGATSYDWELTYEDGIVVTLEQTTVPNVTFECRDGQMFTLKVKTNISVNWSEPSYSIICNPFPGDVNFDCSVNNSDFTTLRNNLGHSCK